MKPTIFTGSGVAIVTPFHTTGEMGIHFEKLAELIEYQIAQNTDCIVICGTTGESSTMTDTEHKAAIQFAVEQVGGRVPVIAGTGVNDTRHAIELSQYAESVGVDGVLCVNPYYNKTTQKGLIAHFTAIAESIPKTPIVLYNVPSRTNMNIDAATIYELSKVENIVAVKECTFSQVAEVRYLCPDDFTIYSGEDGLILPMLVMGGRGVISVMANILPRETHDICQTFFDGNVEESMRLQVQAAPVVKALFAEVSPIPVKAAMNLMGMDVGNCRLPLVEASPNVVDMLKEALHLG